jgi:hypothetical protein
MIGRIARPLSLALLSAALALPLAAQPAPVAHGSVFSLLAQVWERLAAPVTALFAADETDGRGVWDPDGLAPGAPEVTDNDGRSIWDPNG